MLTTILLFLHLFNNIYSQNDVSSLSFVFDVTGSMWDDLEQLREGAGLILKTVLDHQDNRIGEFVLVPFGDPDIGPVTVTNNETVFKAALNAISLAGGGDCPEMSLSGIQRALDVSNPRSFIYVFTDATAKDYENVGFVLNSVQRKEAQIVFILTGHCGDRSAKAYQAYEQIASASSGLIFNLKKTQIHDVLGFVKISVEGSNVNLGSSIFPPGKNIQQQVPIDGSLDRITISVAGLNSDVKVVDPNGEVIDGPPRLIEAVDLSQIKVINLINPEPGNWSITVSSDERHSVKLTGRSKLTFAHGFSVQPPKRMEETSHRPMKGRENYLLIKPSKVNISFHLNYVEILDISGNLKFEVQLTEVENDSDLYVTNAFIPPDNFFYIAVNGNDEFGDPVRRIGSTAIQPQIPELPYITTVQTLEAKTGERILLKCEIESLVPLTIRWMRNNNVIKEVTSIQSTTVELLLSNVSRTDAGLYKCTARNVAGVTSAYTNLTIIESYKAPQTSIDKVNVTFFYGESGEVVCSLFGNPEPNVHWIKNNSTLASFKFEKAINKENVTTSILHFRNVTETEEGAYVCVADNFVGSHNSTAFVLIRRNQEAIEVPRDKTVEINSNTSLECSIISYPPSKITWYHNATRMNQENATQILIENVNFENTGLYTCAAENEYERNSYNATLKVILIPPTIDVAGKTIRISEGSDLLLTCSANGKPTPAIKWSFINLRNKNQTVDHFDETNLKIENISKEMSGRFICHAENIIGFDEQEFDVIVEFAPLFVDDNLDENIIEVVSGETAKINCEVSGIPEPNCEWTLNGTSIEFTRRISFSEGVLTLMNATSTDEGLYSCKVSNYLGSIHRTISLQVLIEPTIVQPASNVEMEVLNGEKVRFTCMTTGKPKPSVAWIYNGKTLSQDDKWNFNIDNTLSFTANISDAGIYRCLAINELGVTSLEYSLKVWEKPSIIPPEHVNTRVLRGNDVKLVCNATGYPAPNITWWSKGEILHNEFGGKANTEFQLKNLSAIHNGGYKCVAENVAGLTEKEYWLDVLEPPKILRSDENLTATTFDLDIEMSCPAIGHPYPDIRWIKDDEYIDASDNYRFDMAGTLRLHDLNELMSGKYMCQASNEVGRDEVSFHVTIYSPPFLMDENSNSAARRTQIGVEGSHVTLECPTKNGLVRWYKNGKLLKSEGKLSIENVTRADSGTFECIASNPAGKVSALIQLDVEWGPEFKTSVRTNVDLIAGDDFSLDCDVNAKPKATVSWFMNSHPLLSQDNILKMFNFNHDADFRCHVSNKYGSVERNFTVSVYVPPYFLDGKESEKVVLFGQEFSLICNAQGKPEPDITWQHNFTGCTVLGEVLKCQNATLDGAVTCTAVNKVGVASFEFNVQIVSKAKVVEISVFVENEAGVTASDVVEVELGKQIRLTCRTEGRPSPELLWVKNGRIMIEATNSFSELVIANVSESDAGIYSCTALNYVGRMNKSFELDVVFSPTITSNGINTPKQEHVTVILDESITLQCRAKSKPAPSIYWFKNGTPLRSFDERVTINGDSLLLKATTIDVEGNYSCVAKNKIGEDVLEFILTVLAPPDQMEHSKRTIREKSKVGQNVTLPCPSSGNPKPKIVWLKHPYMEIEERILPHIHIEENNSLVISNVTSPDSGKYSCIATNALGMSEIIYDLFVIKPPKITRNFGNTEKIVVEFRRSIVLKCIAEGAPTPHIRWLKDTLPLQTIDDRVNVTLEGQSLILYDVKPIDGGQYMCVVENEGGNDQKRFELYVRGEGDWSKWSRWSYCNSTCDRGVQTQTRKCLFPAGFESEFDSGSNYVILDTSTCFGAAFRMRECVMPPCQEDFWSDWSEWSKCSATCGTGKEIRRRACLSYSEELCEGDNVQIRKCSPLPACEQIDLHPEELIDSKPQSTFLTDPKLVEDGKINSTSGRLSNANDCANGFVPDPITGECTDIDECVQLSNKCHSTQLCVNTFGGYHCACDGGFFSLGDGQRCLDVNECLVGLADCEYECINIPGSYACSCPNDMYLTSNLRTCDYRLGAIIDRNEDFYDNLESQEQESTN